MNNRMEKVMFDEIRNYITASLCKSSLLVLFAVSFTLHAEQFPEIRDYTLSREKTPGVESTDISPAVRPTVEVNEQNGIYSIRAVAIVRAPEKYIRHVLTDYQHIYRLNPSIIESEVLNIQDNGTVDVRTRVVGCAAYFCEELDRVEKVSVLPSGDLQADIVPEFSDFKSGRTLWQIKGMGEKSEVNYFSDMEPDVFIPPVVGKFLLKKSIKKEMQISFTNLEKISSFIALRERKKNIQPAYNTMEGNITPGVNSVFILSGTPVIAYE